MGGGEGEFQGFEDGLFHDDLWVEQEVGGLDEVLVGFVAGQLRFGFQKVADLGFGLLFALVVRLVGEAFDGGGVFAALPDRHCGEFVLAHWRFQEGAGTSLS
jgi:hypothetical protein